MLLKNIEENFPFISVVVYGEHEYVGIIANQDHLVTTMYIYTDLKSEKEKLGFLDMGKTWWWESNRTIPISIFLLEEMEQFEYSVMTMNSKDVKVTLGPCVNLHNLSVRRVKRKNVQLVRKYKK